MKTFFSELPPLGTNDRNKLDEFLVKENQIVLEISDLKNKMSDDIRILFTEYRQKRKGNFSSTARRANDLKQ